MSISYPAYRPDAVITHRVMNTKYILYTLDAKIPFYSVDKITFVFLTKTLIYMVTLGLIVKYQTSVALYS